MAYSRYFHCFALILILVLVPNVSYAEGFELQSISARFRISEQTLLGKDAQEDFKEYDLSANFALPWALHSTSYWQIDTRLMTSAGILYGAGKNSLAVSLIPEIVIRNKADWFSLDLGAGGALLSEHRFGVQDFGGPFQFALTLGMNFSVSKKLGIGYRFLHYSDAGLNGSDTTGADFHMLEFSYKL